MTQADATREAALVRELVDAVNAREWDAVLALLAPEFEYDLTRTDSPLRGVYGRAQMRRVIEEFLGPWESVRYEPREMVPVPDGAVVAFTTHFRGRGGIEMQTEAAWLVRTSGDAIEALTLFQDRDEALAAAGA